MKLFTYKTKAKGKFVVPAMTASIGLIRAFAAYQDAEEGDSMAHLRVLNAVVKVIRNGTEGAEAFDSMSVEEFGEFMEAWGKFTQEVAAPKEPSPKKK